MGKTNVLLSITSDIHLKVSVRSDERTLPGCVPVLLEAFVLLVNKVPQAFLSSFLCFIFTAFLYWSHTLLHLSGLNFFSFFIIREHVRAGMRHKERVIKSKLIGHGHLSSPPYFPLKEKEFNVI